ncbi:MAG: TetR/AcrR family transcriptional regulator [Oscillospiraceae bacterium]|nr:TetR/AcrR family transcriptional regulator [Oscillospiraceae bacterium]
MARNKHPEVTVRRILDTAARLFLSRGYEHTSIQDIIDGLDGLSRGAIYHHFKSKEAILLAVMDRIVLGSNQKLAAIRDDPGLTGREKLQAIFRASLQRPEQEAMFALAPHISQSPQLISSLIHDVMDDAAPHYLLPILRQGNADGSLSVAHPEEVAELLLLAANVWMNPMMFRDDPEKSRRKFQVFAQLLQGFGLELMDAEMVDRLEYLSSIYNGSK